MLKFRLQLSAYLKIAVSALAMLGFLQLWFLLIPEGGIWYLALQIAAAALIYFLFITVTGVLDLKGMLKRVFG